MTTPTPFVCKDDLSTSPEKSSSDTDLGGAVRRALLPLLLLLAWYLAAEARLFPPLLLPSPGRVFGAAAELLQSGELFKHAAASLARVVSGFLISAAAALLLAFFFYRRRRWEEGASIVLESLRVVPLRLSAEYGTGVRFVRQSASFMDCCEILKNLTGKNIIIFIKKI